MQREAWEKHDILISVTMWLAARIFSCGSSIITSLLSHLYCVLHQTARCHHVRPCHLCHQWHLKLQFPHHGRQQANSSRVASAMETCRYRQQFVKVTLVPGLQHLLHAAIYAQQIDYFYRATVFIHGCHARYWHSNSVCPFDRPSVTNPHPTRLQIQQDVKIILCLRSGARCSYSYSGRLIRNRIFCTELRGIPLGDLGRPIKLIQLF